MMRQEKPTREWCEACGGFVMACLHSEEGREYGIRLSPLSPEVFRDRMLAILWETGFYGKGDERNEGDVEGRYSEVNELMAETLVALGYWEGVRIFDTTLKWYA
jgi:hypothetical protein